MLWAGALALPSALGGQTTATWSTSAGYSEGRYIFTELSRSWSLYTGVSLQGSRFRLSVGLPVMVLDSRALTFVGDLPLPTGGPDSEAVSRRRDGEPVPMGGGPRSNRSLTMAGGPPLGFQGTGTEADSVALPGDYRVEVADPVITGGVELLEPRGAFLGLDATVSVKVPVRGVESGVGTGEVDWGVGLSAAAGGDGLMVFGGVGWWSYGDLPLLELKDVVSWDAGLGLVLSPRLSGMLTISGSSRVLDVAESPLEVGGLLSLSLGSRVGLNAGAGFGLSEASPDLSLSVGTRITLGNR